MGTGGQEACRTDGWDKTEEEEEEVVVVEEEEVGLGEQMTGKAWLLGTSYVLERSASCMNPFHDHFRNDGKSVALRLCVLKTQLPKYHFLKSNYIFGTEFFEPYLRK